MGILQWIKKLTAPPTLTAPAELVERTIQILAMESYDFFQLRDRLIASGSSSLDACDCANFVPIAFGRQLLRNMFPEREWQFPTHFAITRRGAVVDRQPLETNAVFAEAERAATDKARNDLPLLMRIGEVSAEFGALNKTLNEMEERGRTPTDEDVGTIEFKELQVPEL